MENKIKVLGYKQGDQHMVLTNQILATVPSFPIKLQGP